MARTDFTNGVQLASFKGIYTEPGGVFTPGPLLWENPDAVNGNKFANVRGKCLIVVQNTDDTDDLTITMDATTVVPETPDGLPVQDPTIVIGPGEANLIGPFTGNFESDGEVGLDYTLGGALLATEINIAVIQLP